jgi:hypothetical protein
MLAGGANLKKPRLRDKKKMPIRVTQPSIDS